VAYGLALLLADYCVSSSFDFPPSQFYSVYHPDMIVSQVIAASDHIIDGSVTLIKNDAYWPMVRNLCKSMFHAIVV